MGKKGKSVPKLADSLPSCLHFLSENASIDPGVASLFEQSAGPLKIPQVPNTIVLKSKASRARKSNIDSNSEADEASEASSEQGDHDEDMQDVEGENLNNEPTEERDTNVRSRKRKRTAAEELEESYMRRIAKEERKEEEKQQSEKSKRRKADSKKDDSDASLSAPAESEGSDAPADGSDEPESDEGNESLAIPVHESKTGEEQPNEVEKSKRTVFLGNVSIEAIRLKSAKKTLLRHLESTLSDLSELTGPHKVESIRFRSTAFEAGGQIPKRASYARKEVLDDTTQSTNAYAVYTTIQGARKAATTLNGTVVLDRHLRVDSVAHPSPVDHKRCIFVGNLDFVDREHSAESEEGKKKRSKPADVEEGLWRAFGSSTDSQNGQPGKIESVRVVRDRVTRVGKGFAYVQFYDQNSVEEALLLDGKKFPPMLPRKLRVTRAKKAAKRNPEAQQNLGKGRAFERSDRSLLGRAGKLLGKAGAAKLKASGDRIYPGSTVFEGHRATESGSRIKVKQKSRGSKGKPKTRSSRRAAAYRATGRKEKSKK